MVFGKKPIQMFREEDFFRTVGKSPGILEMSAALRWDKKKLGFCLPFKAPYGSYVS